MERRAPVSVHPSPPPQLYEVLVLRRSLLLMPALIAGLALPVAPALAGEEDGGGPGAGTLDQVRNCVNHSRAKVTVSGDEVDSVVFFVDGSPRQGGRRADRQRHSSSCRDALQLRLTPRRPSRPGRRHRHGAATPRRSGSRSPARRRPRRGSPGEPQPWARRRSLRPSRSRRAPRLRPLSPGTLSDETTFTRGPTPPCAPPRTRSPRTPRGRSAAFAR